MPSLTGNAAHSNTKQETGNFQCSSFSGLVYNLEITGHEITAQRLPRHNELHMHNELQGVASKHGT